MADADGVLWIDLETTGLSHRDDLLLEVAVMVTTYDRRLDVLAAYTAPIKTSRLLHAGMADEVRTMHTANGLLAECAAQGVSPTEADSHIARLMRTVGERFILGGSGVEGFDRAWLPRWLPRTNGRVVLYPHALDMSPLKAMTRLLGRPDLLPPVPPTHRAWDDVQWAVNAARSTMHLLEAS